MSGMILDGRGLPVAPASVIAELQEINPRLGLRYHVGLHAFVVTLTWLENDDRHRFIQEGAMAPDANFDILCPAPANVSLDELRGFLALQLRRVGESREDVRKMVEAEEARLAKQNAAVAEQKLNEAREDLIASASEKTINVGKRRTRVK